MFAYFIILYVGNGSSYDETNITSVIDRAIMGINHMRNDNGIEPESIISLLASVAHVLIGFLAGKMIWESKDLNTKIQKLFILGAVLAFSGFLFSYANPICKKVWSPSFALVTCGFGATALALLIWIIDVKGNKKWSFFFEVFGVNPLFMYVSSEVLDIILANIKFYSNNKITNVSGYFYSHFLQPFFGEYTGSLVYAILFVGLIWGLGYFLYKKRIYIKL